MLYSQLLQKTDIRRLWVGDLLLKFPEMLDPSLKIKFRKCFITSAIGRQRWGNGELKANLGYIPAPHLHPWPGS